MTSVCPSPRVVVVVVTFNRAGLLLQTLEGLKCLSHRPERVVLVDNASSDGTPHRLLEKGWLGDLPPSGEGGLWRWVGEVDGRLAGMPLAMTYLRKATNDGGAGGFAAGIREAMKQECEWLWLMDDDVVPEPDSLGRLLADAGSEPRRVVQQRRVYADGTDVELQATELNLTNPFRELKQGAAHFHGDDSVVRTRTFTFEGLLLPRRLVDEVGLPDTSFFLFADDTDYAIRAKRAGFEIVVSARSRIVKQLRQAGAVEYTERHYYYFRNLYRLDLRYGSPAVRLLRPTLLLLRRLLGCVRRRDPRRSFGIVLRSYRDAWRLERGR